MDIITKIILVIHATIVVIAGECLDGCSLPITIYNDLKCVPKYLGRDDCCPIEYDCSHIYNRTEGTCHLKGKLYQLDQNVKEEDIRGSCQHLCRCQKGLSESEIFCPRLMDGCPEHWVAGYLKPTCYLKHDLNHCCSTGQICPPFERIPKCEVNGKNYKEGQLFNHPKQKCVKCVCQKGFDGKFEEPFCQENKCYAELKNSGAINDNCAPFYNSKVMCCPNKWVCPTKHGQFLPAIEKPTEDRGLKCKFGETTVDIGGRYEEDNGDKVKIYCKCIVPPLMSCGSDPI